MFMPVPSILFVPCNAMQAKRFALVARHLPKSAKVLAVSNANYLKLGAEEALKAAGIEYERLDGLGAESCGRLLDKHSASLVVLGNDSDYISYLFVLAARKRGIRSLMMQDGAIASLAAPPRRISLHDISNLLRIYSPGYMAARSTARLKSKFLRTQAPSLNKMGAYCTDLAVWGDFSRRLFAARGVPASAIHVTGNPTFDELVQVKKSTENAGRKKKQGKVILYASSDMAGARLWTHGEVRNAAEALAAAAQAIPGATLIIRPHPSESPSLYAGLEQKYSRTKVQPGGKLYSLIASADLVLTEISTVAFESILLGKPVGIVNFTGRVISSNYPESYVKSGAALPISKTSNVANQIRLLLHDKKTSSALQKGRERFIREQVFKLDGKASKRVAAIIVKLSSKRQLATGRQLD